MFRCLRYERHFSPLLRRFFLVVFLKVHDFHRLSSLTSSLIFTFSLFFSPSPFSCLISSSLRFLLWSLLSLFCVVAAGCCCCCSLLVAALLLLVLRCCSFRGTFSSFRPLLSSCPVHSCSGRIGHVAGERLHSARGHSRLRRKKAGRRWSSKKRVAGAGNRQKFLFLGLCGKHTLKRCATGALSTDAGKLEVWRNVLWRSTEHSGACPLIVSYVCPHWGLVPMKIIFCGCQKGTNPGRGGSAIGGACFLVSSTTGLRRTGYRRNFHPAGLKTLWNSKRNRPTLLACDNKISALKLRANLHHQDHRRATCSITDAGAAQDEDGAGAASSVTGEGAVKVTVCVGAAYSITGVGVARVTSSAGATYSITGAGAVWTTGTGGSSTLSRSVIGAGATYSYAAAGEAVAPQVAAGAGDA